MAEIGDRKEVVIPSLWRRLRGKPERTLTLVLVAPEDCVMCWGAGGYWDGDHDGSWLVVCDHWVKEHFAPGGEGYAHAVLAHRVAI